MAINLEEFLLQTGLERNDCRSKRLFHPQEKDLLCDHFLN